MLIDFRDIRVGDEVIVSCNSKLRYLKIKKLGVKSHTCTQRRDVIPRTYKDTLINVFETDTKKHNSIFYLKNEGIYRDIWLVNREN